MKNIVSKLALTAVAAAMPFSANSFSIAPPRPSTSHLFTRTTKLHAEGKAPQYDKIDATLRQAEIVGEGSVMLHIDTPTTIDYEPGNVLALEIEGDDNDATINEKNAQDMKNNGGWMRGPYTVSRATDKSFDILLKVVGDKSKVFAAAEPGTALKFGGKFKVPILEGVDAENVKKVVLVSTGVGAGPCIGAIEKALGEDFPPIELHASYRTEGEVLYKEHLDALQKENPDRFAWRAIVSSQIGRISLNEENLQSIGSLFPVDGLDDAHYHLIGNGQMVNEFKAGLAKAGVPEEKVTIEMYFNHKAPVDENVVDRIAKVVAVGCGATV